MGLGKNADELHHDSVLQEKMMIIVSRHPREEERVALSSLLLFGRS